MPSNGASVLQVPLETRIYLRNNQYCTLSTATLALHCWISTFDEEVATFWKGTRVTGATIIFTLNRYLGLLYAILCVIRSVADLSDKVQTQRLDIELPLQSCAALLLTTNVLGQVLTLIAAAFTALRVFALSKKSWSLALICFGIPLCPVALLILVFKGIPVSAKSMGPGLGCAYTSDWNWDAKNFVVLWSESFIADGQLIYFTWVAISPLRGMRAANLARGRTLLHVFLRNEILYFIVIIGASTLAFAIEIVFLVNPARNYTYIVTFTGIIPCLLISQFLLELQAADGRARAGGSQLSSADSRMSDLVFQRVVGSIGHGPLTSPEDEDEDEFPDEVGGGETSSLVSVWKSGLDGWSENDGAVEENGSSIPPI